MRAITKHRWYWVAGFLILLTLLIGVAWNFFHRPVTYEIPADYHGWVIIQYGDSKCPALRADGIRLVIDIPPSGCSCTSSKQPEGFRQLRFELVQLDGTRHEIEHRPQDGTGIWGSHDSGWGPNRLGYKKFLRENFFVGSKSEFQEQARFHPVTNYPETKVCADLDEHGQLNK